MSFKTAALLYQRERLKIKENLRQLEHTLKAFAWQQPNNTAY